MKYNGRVLLVVFLCVCLGVCLRVQYKKLNTPPVVEHRSPILVTAAHIPEDSFQGYTLLYKDTDRDTAYYLAENYEYYIPEVGERVYYSDLSSKVVYVEEGLGFYIQIPPDSNVYQGMSGTKVRDSGGNEIAFISQLKNNMLFCISIR